MLTINWNDIKLNGMPAINRALETLVKEFNALETRHNLELHLLTQQLRRLEIRVLANGDREIVEELGHGWRIERQPAAPNANAATSDPPAATMATPPNNDGVIEGALGTCGFSWLPDDWVTQYTAAVDGD